MKLVIGPGALRNYQRLPYQPWYALAEFVDNSLQAYEDHKKELQALPGAEALQVFITHDLKSGILRISDNASGMSMGELEEAMVVGQPPENTSGLSEFGMGMKTAAIWFGDRWTVKTKRFDENVEHSVTFTLPEPGDSESSMDLHYRSKAVIAQSHYTIIEISQLERQLRTKTVSKIHSYLGSIYRLKIRSGELDLRFNNRECRFDLYDDSGKAFRSRHDGSRWRQDIAPFQFKGRMVWGWLGLLEKGGRERAGISLIRRGRVIQGWPDAWKPDPPFGTQEGGSNTLVSQRLVGELHLDDFPVSHSKDRIAWDSDEEAELAEKLVAKVPDMIAEAKKTWGKRGQAKLDEKAVERALAEAAQPFEAEDFAEQVRLSEVAAPEVIQSFNQSLLKRATPGGIMERFTLQLAGPEGKPVEVREIWHNDLSSNDPYLVVEADSTRVDILINRNHPYLEAGLADEQFVVEYVRQCLFDGLAEWKARRLQATMEPETIRSVKDGLMRNIGLELSSEE